MNSPNRGRLEGRTALVTGARQGIGRAIAIELARQGAHVAVEDRSDDNGELTAVAEEIRDAERRSISFVADVSHGDEVHALFTELGDRLGPIDLLVNNAGVESIVPIAEITETEWERVTHTNLKGEFLCLQAAAAVMRGLGRGAVVNIGSVQAGMALPGRTHYAPSKRAVEALTANAAAELAPHGIRVNCVHPGLIETQMTRWVLDDPHARQEVMGRIALGRAGSPSEVARVVAFLLSDEASYVTGQSLYVDGGFRIL